MDVKQWLLFAAGLVVFAVAGYLWWKQEKKKADQLAAEAEKNGWTYQRTAVGQGRRYRNLPFVTHDAESKKIKHVMRGEFRGRPVTLFTYQFKREDDDFDLGNAVTGRENKRTKNRRYGVVTVGLPTKLPDLELKRRDSLSGKARDKGLTLSNFLGDEASGLLGGAVDIGDDAFDDTFVVKTRDVDFARRMFSAEVREWMLASEKAKKYRVVIEDNEIITWGTGTDVGIGKVKANYLNDLLDRVPASVLGGPLTT